MQKQSFNHGWRFYLGETPTTPWSEIDYSAWRALDLPHDWSIELDRSPDNPSGVSNGWFTMGRAWYCKTFEAQETWREKKVLVEFEGIYMNAEVWLNENYLGRHPYGYTSFAFDLSSYLKYGEENLLRVSVDNAAQTNSRWYSGSGIYRPVWLMVAEKIHAAHWGVSVTTPQVTSESAAVHVQVQVENETQAAAAVSVRARIFAPDGALAGEAETQTTIAAGGQAECVQAVTVTQPALWSPETPDLYRVETDILVSGAVVDSVTTPFGIRSLAFSAEKGFLLNGQPVKMKGGCVHHDNGVMGAASFPRSEERKVELLKASGYNAIRCAHNPPAPAFLDACDRLGMLVIDESFDCWREGKNPYDYHISFDDWWQRDIASMVLRDRNHPSVIIWSIGNEVLERDGRSGGEAIARALAEYTRRLDPTRPVTSAICGVWDKQRTWEDTDPVFATLDIGGYNYQWKQYRPDHDRHPQRIIMGTESTPMEAFDHWMSVLELDYVIGDFLWTSLDYLGESGIGRVDFEEKNKFLGGYPWHQAYCGDIDLAGFKRPQSYYRDILWGRGEKLYIAVHTPIPEGKTPKITYWGWPDVGENWTWPGKEGQTFTIEVYSACDKVELFLNGLSLGVKPTGRAERFTATFEMPYEPGELKAIGFNGDQHCAQATLHTAGASAAIRLTPDRGTIQAEADDLSFVTVEVVDAEGLIDPNAEDSIHFTVEGEGEIAAVGSGNPTGTECYRGSQQKVFHGRCVVVVKSTGNPGPIRLRASAEGTLQAAEIQLQAR